MRILQAAYGLVIVLVLFAVGIAYYGHSRANSAFKGYPEQERFFKIDRGETGYMIGRGLEDAGIIEDQTLFLIALRIRGETERLQTGEYRFSRPLSTLEVARRLVQGDIYTFAVTIPEGLTVQETAEHVAASGLSNKTDLENSFRNTELSKDIEEHVKDLEGYLFPTTYQFTRNATSEQIVNTMINQFETVFNEEKRIKSKELGLTPHQVITLASLVEKETGAAEERPLVASVFWNRLKLGMRLASDPTIIYALKIEGKYDGNLRRIHLELDSPYNTYRVPGIPPGPIASPGEDSIDAVLNPTNTKYLFFVSKNDGTSHFSTTYREHAKAVQKYQVEFFRKKRRPDEGNSS